MSEHEHQPPEEQPQPVEPQPEEHPVPADAPPPEEHPPERDPAASAAEHERSVREAQAENPGEAIHNIEAKPIDPNHPELPRVPRDGTEDDTAPETA